MAFKVLFLVAVAAVAGAGHLVVPITGYSFARYAHANPTAEAQPLLDAALHAHAAFISFLKNKVPLRYNWGYQVTDPRTGNIKSQYESRYGDLVHGSYTLQKTDRTGITLFYAVNDLNREISALRMEPAVARQHIPVIASKVNVNRAASLLRNDPLGVAAARAHDSFLRYFRDAVPTRYSWEFDVQDPDTGDNKSQYQSRYDDIARGSYTLAKSDGSSRTIYYSIDNGNNIVIDRAETSEPLVGPPTVDVPTSLPVVLLYTSQLY